MSLREDLNSVKEELSSQEKFLESAIKTERFVKKYKKPVIAVFVVTIVAITANFGYNLYDESNTKESNVALLSLLNNGNDENAKAILKDKNQKLFDLWSLSDSIKKGDFKNIETLEHSKATLVGDIASYEAALNKKDFIALENYTKNQDAIYKDLATIELAINLIEQNKIGEAQKKLMTIEKSSSVYDVAEVLMHYGVK